MARIKLFICLLCASCTTPMFISNPSTNLPLYQCKLPVNVYIDRSIPLEDYITIVSSIKYWNTELDSEVFVIRRNQGYSLPLDGIIVHSIRGIGEEKTTVGQAWMNISKKGCISDVSLEYYSDKVSSIFFRWVIIHEAGHSLGLSHSDKKMDLMSPTRAQDAANVPRVRNKRKKALINIYHLGD